MREIWIDVRDYEGLYEVSNWGRVKSVERGVIVVRHGKPFVKHLKEKTLNPKVKKSGHLEVRLYKNGKWDYKLIHVLLAEAFIDNPNNYNVVHHIDFNPQNNCISNLMWMSREEHSAMHMREKETKTVYQYTLDGFLVKVWKSAAEASETLGFSEGNICQCCNNKYLRECNNKYKGYRWSYEPL